MKIRTIMGLFDEARYENLKRLYKQAKGSEAFIEKIDHEEIEWLTEFAGHMITFLDGEFEKTGI